MDRETSVNLIEKQVDRLANIGILSLVSGPVFLLIASLFPYDSFIIVKMILSWIALVMPAVGAVFSIISIVKSRRSKTSINGLTIGTLVMCNPFFYYFYFIICSLVGYISSEVSMM